MNKIEILDGAMGSELICHGESLPNHIWSAKINLTNPDLIYKIHKAYINQGANYITTNTFRTTFRAFKKTGLTDNEASNQAQESFEAAIHMAQKASNKKNKILGSIAPLEDCYMPELFPGTKQATKEFELIGNMFYDSGIDFFILETMNSIIETQACLEALSTFKIPIWVSFNLLNEHQIRSGESLKDAIKLINQYSVDCLLLNCNPFKRTLGALTILKNHWNKNWGVYPNLGTGEPAPDGIIKEYYSEREFLKFVNQCIDMGASVLGGCCGSNPKHIKLIKEYINTK